jgi:hydrogenase expression/formation protein HypC
MMCLAFPGKVISLQKGEKNIGIVDFSGVTREVCFDLVPDINIGDYVLVHAGFAIEKFDPDEARKSMASWEEIKNKHDLDDDIYG